VTEPSAPAIPKSVSDADRETLWVERTTWIVRGGSTSYADAVGEIPERVQDIR